MRARPEDLPIALELPGAVFRVDEWGDTAVAHVRLSAGTDATPVLEGLPGDKCACPHWGYILEGAVHLRYADGKEETARAGDFYYWPPGHTVWVDEDTTFVEFSPKGELREVYDHIRRKAGLA